MANNRDEFSEPTKRALAFRASHTCSFDGCNQSTVGPSGEAPDAVSMIGVATHICAAAPGGRRYDPAITPEERSAISNGIWLCQTHSVVTDRDEVSFPAARLREMKRRHEASRSFDPNSQEAERDDIIAIGSSIIAAGEFSGIDPNGWRVRINYFITGDHQSLIAFCGDFDSQPEDERYAVINELGDGRVLREAPSVNRQGNEFEVVLPISPSFPRTTARSFGSMMAVSPDTHDMFIENGHIARVSGVDAFAQHLSSLMGLAKGDNIFHPKSGTMISRFYKDFAGSPWLDRLLKMEVIRLAAIPVADRLLKSMHTPLRCVNRVREVIIVPGADQDRQRIPFCLRLDVNGVGSWSKIIPVFIYTDEQLEAAANRTIPPWAGGCRFLNGPIDSPAVDCHSARSPASGEASRPGSL